MISINLFLLDEEHKERFKYFTFEGGTEDGYEKGKGLLLGFFGVSVAREYPFEPGK